MILEINLDLLNEEAFSKISKEIKCETKKVHCMSWIMAISLPNGDTLASYGGIINPLSAPYLSMTKYTCHEMVNNREYPTVIYRRLKKYCDDPQLLEAIKIIRDAIWSISEK